MLTARSRFLTLLMVLSAFYFLGSNIPIAADDETPAYRVRFVEAPAEDVLVNTVDILVSGVVETASGTPAPGVKMSFQVDNRTFVRYTRQDGSFSFSYFPDQIGVYNLVVAVPELGLEYTLSDIGYDPIFTTVGGTYDYTQLYYDYGRQFGNEHSVFNFISANREYLRFGMFRITIDDSTFDWTEKYQDEAYRQFPNMDEAGGYEEDTFPWLNAQAYSNGDHTATTHNNAANDINNGFFSRMENFIRRYTNCLRPPGAPPLMIIVSVFDSWSVIHNGMDDPWRKAAYTHEYDWPYEQIFAVTPSGLGNSALRDNFKAYLDKLADCLADLPEDEQSFVVLEFNNEYGYNSQGEDVTPSNNWLYLWTDYLYRQLVSAGAEDIAQRIMINAFIGNPYTYHENGPAAYTENCWADPPVWEITSVVSLKRLYND